jgi:hypothetical protein
MLLMCALALCVQVYFELNRNNMTESDSADPSLIKCNARLENALLRRALKLDSFGIGSQ